MARHPKAPAAAGTGAKPIPAVLKRNAAPEEARAVTSVGAMEKIPARRGRPPKLKAEPGASAFEAVSSPAPAVDVDPVKALLETAAPVPVPPAIASSVPAPAEPPKALEVPQAEPAVSESAVSETAPLAEPEPEISTPPPQPVAVEPQPAAIVATPTKPSVEGKYIMSEAFESTKLLAEDAQSRMQSMFTEFNDKTKTAMEKSAKAFEEIGDLAKGNLEAVVESSKIAAKGFESISQTAAELSRQSFEKTSSTMKSFASVKSPAEFFQLHSELMSQTIDTLAAEAARTSESLLKLAGEVAQPISSRVAIVTDKMKAMAS